MFPRIAIFFITFLCGGGQLVRLPRSLVREHDTASTEVDESAEVYSRICEWLREEGELAPQFLIPSFVLEGKLLWGVYAHLVTDYKICGLDTGPDELSQNGSITIDELARTTVRRRPEDVEGDEEEVA